MDVRRQIGEGVEISGPEELLREAGLDICDSADAAKTPTPPKVRFEERDPYDCSGPMTGLAQEDDTKVFSTGRAAARYRPERDAYYLNTLAEILENHGVELGTAAPRLRAIAQRLHGVAGDDPVQQRGDQTEAPDQHLVTSAIHPGDRVWDVRTGGGPWALIAPTTLNIPAQLPPEPDGFARLVGRYVDPTYEAPSYREVTVAAWVVEVDAWNFLVIPAGCLTNEAPLHLSSEMLAQLEAEAAEETMAELAEEQGETTITRARQEIDNLREQRRRAHLRSAVVMGMLIPTTAWLSWLLSHFG